MARRSKTPQSIEDMVNSLTPEQAVRMIQIVDPLTEQEQAEFDAMSNDDLLAALQS